jgi:NADPH-dependent curcumin reductase CurA
VNRSNCQVLLAERPDGPLELRHFRTATAKIGEPGPGQVLCRTVLLSVDPANRAWMQGRTYRGQISSGEVMAGFTLCEVLAGDLAAGTIVTCEVGWQEYAIVSTSEVRPITVRGPLTDQLGVLGITGLTAYFGLIEVGQPRPGDTVVVSAAAGATGHIVGQLARLAGCRVVGIAGSADKCRILTERLRFDAAVSHRSPVLRQDLRVACPDGVDVYFDNVGGPVLDATLSLMNERGRVVCCGVVSQYDTSTPAPGPRGVPGYLVTKRLRMEGILVSDFHDRWPVGEERLAGWLASGELIALQDVIEGLGNAPTALIGLLKGDNVGKRMVRVGPDPH